MEQLGAMEPDQLLQLLGGVVGCAVTMLALTVIYIVLARRSGRTSAAGVDTGASPRTREPEAGAPVAVDDQPAVNASVAEGRPVAVAQAMTAQPAALDVGARLAGTGRDAWQAQRDDVGASTTGQPDNGQEILRVVQDVASDRVWVKVAGVRYARLNEVRDRSIGERILAATTWALRFSNGRAASDQGVITIDLPPCDAVAVPPAVGSLSDVDEPGELFRLLGRTASRSDVFRVQVGGRCYAGLGEIEDAQAGQIVLEGISCLLQFSHGRIYADDGVRVVPVPRFSLRPQSGLASQAQRVATVDEEEAFLQQMRRQLEDTTGKTGRGPGRKRGAAAVAGSEHDAHRSFNLVDEIDRIFQRKLQASPLARVDAQLVSGPEGSVRIRVGTRFYDRPDAVPDADLRGIIESAIAEW